MTNKKITKAQRNEDIIALLSVLSLNEFATDDDRAIYDKAIARTSIADAIAHLTHENALLAKKNSGDAKKPTKAQEENNVFKAGIVRFMFESGKPLTATEVMNGCNLASNQKAAALLRALKDEGKVVKTIDKNKALFTLADGVVPEVTSEGEGD